MAGPVAGWSALVLVFGACTSSRDEASTPPAAGDLEAAPVLCSDCELLEWAGGESSEFSGGNPICAIAASTVRPLSDPELAPMLAWVEGQRELSLRWHQNFVTDGVSGYAEQSSVVVDVRVMGARDVVLESGCSPNDELLLDLAIDLATSDGALRGTFTQSVRRLRGDDQFVTNLLQGEDPTLPLGNFRGSLDLDIDPTSPVGGVFIQLAFSPAGLRGRVLPTVSNAVTELWSPLEARFPDDGCGYNRWPVPMDRPLASLGGDTLANVLQSKIEPWLGPLPAQWSDEEPTQVNLDFGAPEQACAALLNDTEAFTNTFRLNVPLRVRSADGALDLSETAVFDMVASGAGTYTQVSYDRAFIPVSEMMSVPGIGQPTPDADALYAAPSLYLVYADDNTLFNGNFHIQTWPENGRSAGEQWLWWEGAANP